MLAQLSAAPTSLLTCSCGSVCIARMHHALVLMKKQTALKLKLWCVLHVLLLLL